MAIYISLHRIAKAILGPDVPSASSHSVTIECDAGRKIDLWDSKLKCRAIAEAVNFPVPDLLCDVDARLGELTQIGAHEYRYGDYIIIRLNAPIPGTLWVWINDKRGGGEAEHEGTCFSIIGCLDECDEHFEEMEEREFEAELEAALREAADDDRAHAQRERAWEEGL